MMASVLCNNLSVIGIRIEQYLWLALVDPSCYVHLWFASVNARLLLEPNYPIVNFVYPAG